MDVLKNLKDTIEVTLLAHKLHSLDSKATMAWMEEPNEFLFKVSPLEVCIRGDSASLKKWLKDKLGE